MANEARLHNVNVAQRTHHVLHTNHGWLKNTLELLGQRGEGPRIRLYKKNHCDNPTNMQATCYTDTAGLQLSRLSWSGVQDPVLKEVGREGNLPCGKNVLNASPCTPHPSTVHPDQMQDTLSTWWSHPSNAVSVYHHYNVLVWYPLMIYCRCHESLHTPATLHQSAPKNVFIWATQLAINT